MPNTKQPNSFSAFFSELGERLTSATPKFFAVLRNIAAVIAALAGFVQIAQESGVDFPDLIDKAFSWITLAAAVAAAIIAQLPTVDKANKVQTGELPFTAKAIAEGKESAN